MSCDSNNDQHEIAPNSALTEGLRTPKQGPWVMVEVERGHVLELDHEESALPFAGGIGSENE